jgi:hypothetical protein
MLFNMKVWKGIDTRLDMLLQSGLTSTKDFQFIPFDKDDVNVQLGYGEYFAIGQWHLFCVYRNVYYCCKFINSRVGDLDKHEKVFNTLRNSTFRLTDFTVTEADAGTQRRICTVFTNSTEGKWFNPLTPRKICIEWEKSKYTQIFQLDQSTPVILNIVHASDGIHYVMFIHKYRKFRHDMADESEEERVLSFLWSDDVELTTFREHYRRYDTYAHTTFQSLSGEKLEIDWKVDEK